MLIFGITVIVAVAVVATALAYHYKWEAQFHLDQLNELSASYIKMVDETHDQVSDLRLALQMSERDNTALSHDLSQYIAAAMFDAWTIRNMTVSIEGLSNQIDGLLIEHAKLVLGAEEVIDDCTCEPGEAPCKDTACTCVHHKWNVLPLDQV